jgi:uncharacterized protein (DUF58 family)
LNFSSRSYLIAGLIVVLGVFGQWWGGETQHLWRFPAAAWLLALTLEGLWARRERLHLVREVPPRASLGQPLPGVLSLRNPGAYPLTVEAMPYYPPLLDGAQSLFKWRLPPGQSASREFSVVPVGLGETAWGPIYARLLGRWGLAWWNKTLADPSQTRILPEHAHHAPHLPGTRETGERQAGAARHGGELLYLRDYQPGDPLRGVDWKATARRGKPVVRLYSEQQHLEIMLLLDAGRGSRIQAGRLTRLHHALNVAARLSEIALQQGDRVGLVSFAEGPLEVVPPDKGNRALLRIRQCLARARSQPRESNPLAAVLETRRLLKQRGLVVLFTDIEESEAAQQLVQATHLLVPKHVPLIASLLDEEIESLRDCPAQDWLDPYRSYAAQHASLAVQRSARQLQRLGGCVVLARPAQLDAAVLNYYHGLRQRRRV